MNKDIDTISLRCPEPLMIVRRELRNLNKGDTVTVTADDPSTERDFKLLCMHMGYTLISQSKEDDILLFKIQK